MGNEKALKCPQLLHTTELKDLEGHYRSIRVFHNVGRAAKVSMRRRDAKMLGTASESLGYLISVALLKQQNMKPFCDICYYGFFLCYYK